MEIESILFQSIVSIKYDYLIKQTVAEQPAHYSFFEFYCSKMDDASINNDINVINGCY